MTEKYTSVSIQDPILPKINLFPGKKQEHIFHNIPLYHPENYPKKNRHNPTNKEPPYAVPPQRKKTDFTPRCNGREEERKTFLF